MRLPSFIVVRSLAAAWISVLTATSFSAIADEIDPAAIDVTPPKNAPLEPDLPGKFNPFATDVPPEKKAGKNRKKKTTRPQGNKTGKPVPQTQSQPPLQAEPESKSFFEGQSDLVFTGGLESVSSFALGSPAVDLAKVSDDQILLPYFLANQQIYPSLKVNAGKSFLFSTRPRLSLFNQRAKKSNGRDSVANRFRSDAGEIFAVLTPSSRFSLTVGKHNFQWGVAESASPSNWIFRARTLASTLTRNPQTEVETRDLIRFNLSLGQSINVVGMAEYEPEAMTLPRTYQGRRVLLKPEVSWNSGADAFGLILAGAEKQRFPFFGQYLTINVSQALAVYADIAEFQRSDVVKPVRLALPLRPGDEPVVVFDQPLLQKDTLQYEGVAGVRYTLSNGVEIKSEFYFNSYGLTEDEIADIARLERSASPLLPVFFEPGVEYRFSQALLLSVRHNSFGPRNAWTYFLRWLKPLAGSSGVVLGYGEYLLSDNGVLFLSAGGYHGNVISQSTLLQRFVFSSGYKYVW